MLLKVASSILIHLRLVRGCGWLLPTRKLLFEQAVRKQTLDDQNHKPGEHEKPPGSPPRATRFNGGHQVVFRRDYLNVRSFKDRPQFGFGQTIQHLTREYQH